MNDCVLGSWDKLKQNGAFWTVLVFSRPKFGHRWHFKKQSHGSHTTIAICIENTDPSNKKCVLLELYSAMLSR